MQNNELRAFLLVLRQALLMVVAYIEKNYMDGKPQIHAARGTSTPVVGMVAKDSTLGLN